MKAKTATETESFDAAELGAMMREMRENLGHELEFVARDLRIRLVYLEAIEDGRLRDLPGNAYISGFLRSYSDFLGLEGDEIVRRFKMAGAEISSQPQLHLPSPVEEGRLPTGSILLFAAVIAAAAYGGWYYLSAAGKGPIETVASLPKELSGLVNEAKNQTDAKAVSPSAPAPSVPPTSVPSTSEPVSSAASTSAAPSAEVPSPSAPSSSAPSPSAPSPSAMPSETAAATTEPPASPLTESQAAPDTAETPTAPESAASQDAAEAVPDTRAPAETGSAASTAPAVATAVVPAPASPPDTRQPDAPETDTGNAATPRAAVPSTPAVATTVPAAAPAPAPVAPAEPATETVSQTANVAPAPDPVSTASAPAPDSVAGGVRIVVRATADSYVAVRTGDNEPLFSQLMRPGDSYEVPSGADLVLETGNAGGLQITIGDKRAPPLGPVGQIRRNIPLDAEKLLRGLN
tara:strand:+ start:17294 stop:18682 length:1389 start_codon:yes stop_codon:yes gene_type:complete